MLYATNLMAHHNLETDMENKLQELIYAIRQWGDDRNLTDPENLTAQTMKLVSEFGEIGEGMVLLDSDKVADAIGDTLVVAIIICEQLGCTLDANEIENVDNEAILSEFEHLASKVGLFVDAVLKKHPVEDLYPLILHVCKAVVMVNDDYFTAPVYEALEGAYDEIKDRKGVMYQGAFIKEADPRYADVMRELGRAP